MLCCTSSADTLLLRPPYNVRLDLGLTLLFSLIFSTFVDGAFLLTFFACLRECFFVVFFLGVVFLLEGDVTSSLFLVEPLVLWVDSLLAFLRPLLRRRLRLGFFSSLSSLTAFLIVVTRSAVIVDI